MRVSGRDASIEELPHRPYLPPVSCLALASCFICALVLDAAWKDLNGLGVVGRTPELWVERAALRGFLAFVLLTSVATLIVLIGVWAHRRVRGGEGIELSRGGRSRCAMCLRFALIGLLAGLAGSLMWLDGWKTRAARLEGCTASEFAYIVHGDPRVTPTGAIMEAEAVDFEGVPVATVVMVADEPYGDGEVLRLVGRLESLSSDEWSRGRFMAGQAARLRVVSIRDSSQGDRPGLIASLRDGVLGLLDPASGEVDALLAGMLCGRTTELGQTQADEAFSRCGLTHLVSVSGGHLALIVALLEAARRAAGVGGSWWRGCSMAIMACYVVFTGGSPSAIRSVIMMAGSFLALFGGRRPHPLSSLALTVFALCCVRPGIVFDLGFQLSALSVLFILALSGYISHALRVVCLPRRLADPLSLTLCAQWATVPLTLPAFGELSLVAPFANIVVAPFMNVSLVSGLIAAPLGLLLDADWVFAPARLTAAISIFLARVMEGVPCASVVLDAADWFPLFAYGLAAMVFLAWPDVSAIHARGWLCALGFAGVAWVARWMWLAPPSVTVMDVGQGDAILIRDGSSSLLVDAGIDDATARALMRNHVFHLDGVLVTHWDRDHWGGLPRICDMISVDRLIMSCGAASAMPVEVGACELEGTEVRAGDRLRVGRFTLTVVWPRESVTGEENAESLCLLVEFCGDEGWSMLLTGDAEREELGEIAPVVGDVDVLKIGHHGSRESVDGDVLAVLDPEVSVASAGEGNSYGHPSDECVKAVRSSGSEFLCTIDHGDIVIRPNP